MSGEIFESLEDSMFEFIFYERLNFMRLSKSKKDEEEPLKVPGYTGLIIKTTFVKDENSGRKFPNKSYFDYEPEKDLNDLEKMDKKTISSILKEKVVDFIKTNNYLSDEFDLIEKSTSKKTKKVKYEIKFSDYLKFNIELTPLDFEEEDVSDFILNLPKKQIRAQTEGNQLKGGEGGDQWKVELAKSSRATCRTCGEKIQKETIRIGQPSYYQDHLSYKWFHLDCVNGFKNFPLDGLDTLSSEDQELVKSKLFTTEEAFTKEGMSNELDDGEIIKTIINQYKDSDGLTAEADVYKYAKEKGITDNKIKDLILQLEEDGFLYRPDTGKLKLI